MYNPYIYIYIIERERYTCIDVIYKVYIHMRNIFFRYNIYIMYMYIYFTHCRLLGLILGARHRCLCSVILSPMILLLNSPCAIEGPWLILKSPNFIHDNWTMTLLFPNKLLCFTLWMIYIYIFASRKGWSWNLSGARSCYIPSRWVVPHIYIYMGDPQKFMVYFMENPKIKWDDN